MERALIENRDLEIDLESGGTCSEEDSSSSMEPSPGTKNKVEKKLFEEDEVSVCIHLLDSNGVENLKLVRNQKVEGKSEEKKEAREKRKKMSNKKPPRPPRGPSLDACDEKLIRDLTEIAMLKRARMERMKALKKMKSSKSSSSNNNLIAMVFTILFFIVIIVQGIMPSTRSTLTTFQGPSPESLGGPEAALISVHYNPTSSLNPSQNLVEQVTGSDAQRTSG